MDKNIQPIVLKKDSLQILSRTNHRDEVQAILIIRPFGPIPNPKR